MFSIYSSTKVNKISSKYRDEEGSIKSLERFYLFSLLMGDMDIQNVLYVQDREVSWSIAILERCCFFYKQDQGTGRRSTVLVFFKVVVTLGVLPSRITFLMRLLSLACFPSPLG